MSYTFTQLATDWSSLTDVEREALFENTNFNQATLAELQTLGKFKVLAMSDSDSGSASDVQVLGVHDDFLVLPKSLFGSSFYSIKSVDITESISDTENAKIRYALTKNLTDYYTFSNGEWVQLSAVNAETVITNGLSASDLALISASNWADFYNGTDDNGVGIAFAFHETAVSQVTAIDNLEMTVDMKGTWNKATHNTDYDYGYSNTQLVVNLKTNGSYRINYSA
jgi:hypothetical protein